MNQTKRKILLIVLAVVLVACAGVGGTLALFNANSTAANKFMVASYDPNNPPKDPDKIFSVKVNESVSNYDLNNDGIPDVTANSSGGYDYKNITPGMNMSKVAVVNNTGLYDQYIRVKVVFNNASEWKTVMQRHGISSVTSFLKGLDGTKWTSVGADVYDSAKNTLTCVYLLNRTLAPTNSETLFTSLAIPMSFDQNDFASLNGSFNVSVTAEAIQTVGWDNYAAHAYASKIAYAFAVFDGAAYTD